MKKQFGEKNKNLDIKDDIFANILNQTDTTKIKVIILKMCKETL